VRHWLGHFPASAAISPHSKVRVASVTGGHFLCLQLTGFPPGTASRAILRELPAGLLTRDGLGALAGHFVGIASIALFVILGIGLIRAGTDSTDWLLW